MARVLVVDDENLMRTMVEVACRRLGHEALCAATLAEGRRLAAAGVDVILLDMLLPDGNGLDAQQELAALPDAPDIVVITGHGDGDAAEKALRGGVWDFLMKPVRVRDVEETLSHVLEARDRRRSRRGLELEPGQVAGSGPAMQAALAQLEQAAHSDVNVLLLGETGVGKELFARTLYRNSHRASRPFVAVDCASLPETLVESHLFGHARGAFTGAERASEGLLRAAHQGTLFLDEVGDLPQGIQRAFLRALELRRFRPVGEVREVESDFRLVAATNQDLEAMSEDGRFRKDLLYRLQGMTIVIPPLRRRRDEIPLLARQAVIRCCRRNGMEEKELWRCWPNTTGRAMCASCSIRWSGPVWRRNRRPCCCPRTSPPACAWPWPAAGPGRDAWRATCPAAGRSVPRWPKPGPVACPTCLPCRKRGGPFLRCAAGGMRRSGTMWPGYGRCAATMPGPPHAWPVSLAGTGTNC